jgi:hypothetical protein
MNNNSETFADCNTFPCEKLKNWDKGDSFVTHKICLVNLNGIRMNGIKKFLKQQNIRTQTLKEFLDSFNDGRSKSFFCIASSLLSIEDLQRCIDSVQDEIKESQKDFKDVKSKSKLMKANLNRIAAMKKIDLKLRR